MGEVTAKSSAVQTSATPRTYSPTLPGLYDCPSLPPPDPGICHGLTAIRID